MEGIDLAVLRALRDWRRQGRSALLATVVRTWGSSPRPVGSILAIRDDGALIGSVSGGCIEDDLVRQQKDALCRERPHRVLPEWVRYGVTADEAHRFGLPCGGTLELLLEFNPDAASLQELVGTLESGRLVTRSVSLEDGRVSLASTQFPSELSVGQNMLTSTFGPEYRLLVIGAGQLSEYLATMAVFSGFAVTVCDPRREYRDGWSTPGVAVATVMPDDAVRDFRPDARSCVVALTHDPKLDDLALLEALQSSAFYIGAIGSRRNQQARKKRLIEHFDQTEASLRRLRGPIGIYIGSKTPPEIAVSVMAEILAVKNGVNLPDAMAVSSAKDALDTKSRCLAAK